MKGLLGVLLLVALCAAAPTQLTYTVGQNYVYNVTAVVQNNGYDTVQGDLVPGYYSTMNAVMVMQPTKSNDTAYEFVMNLFNTVVSVNNDTTLTALGASGTALGEDVYFVQMKTGQITLIEYYSNDPIYYVNVKIGAINAFQTSIVSAGDTMNILESDPVGNHEATIKGSLGSNGVLYLTKTFNQADFSAFPDPTLSPNNMEIEATAVAGVHPEGYIVSSTQNQMAVLSNIANTPKVGRVSSMTNSTGFDMDLSAVGTMNVNFLSNNAAQFTSRPFAAKVKNTAGLVETTFFQFAAQASASAKVDAFTIDIEQALVSMIKYKDVQLKTLTSIGNHLRYNPKDMSYLTYFLEDANMLADATTRDRLFFVLTVAQNQEMLVKYGLMNANCDVVTRAVLAAAQFKAPSQQLTSTLQQISTSNKCPVAQGSARSVLSGASPKVSDSQFPFNKSYSAAYDLGGKVAGIDFTADLFVGTNFNCNNPQFNYEGSAEATATAVLFGQSQQAFDAKIIYGQANGSPLADAITLSVWGNQIYNQPIPTVACKDGSYPLAHAAPGFNVEHTLWVSIIPIVFQASASLVLDLKWGWDVCPTDLSADVYLVGNGQIQLSGSSYTDLLLLRAGFDLSGAFNAAITPKAYIKGTACTAGIEVDEANTPMSAAVTSSYQWRHCKFLFFNCDWGKENEHQWWGWSTPAKQSVLFEKSYTIAH